MEDENVYLAKVFEYLVDFIGLKNYRRRKNGVACFDDRIASEGYLRTSDKNKDGQYLSTIYEEDYFINYLYQLDQYLNNPTRSNFSFCARFIPKILSIGVYFDEFKQIINVEKKIRKMVKEKNRDVDNDLFEILVCLLYWKNEAKSVELIQECSTKTPDIKANIKGNVHYAECKKRIKESLYAKKEREKWYLLFKPINKILIEKKLTIIINITFHKELTSYSDDYLLKRLKLVLDTPARGVIIDDQEITISIKDAFIDRTKRHLRDNSVRNDTPLIQKLLFDFYDPKKGITYNILSKLDDRNDKYIDDVNGGNAGIWYCDSEESKVQKARSLRKRVSKALEQFPDNSDCSIHLCYEPYDGDDVIKKFMEKNIEDLIFFDYKDKKLHGIYFHLLSFFMTPDVLWEYEENCFYLYNKEIPDKHLLSDTRLLV